MKKCGCKKGKPHYMHEEYMKDDDCMPMHSGHMMHDKCMPMHGGHMMHDDCMPMHSSHMMPGMDKMMMAKMNMDYFRMHADPITEYACMQAKKEGVMCAIMEAALLGLLIGMGYSHEKAHMILDSWKKE